MRLASSEKSPLSRLQEAQPVCQSLALFAAAAAGLGLAVAFPAVTVQRSAPQAQPLVASTPQTAPARPGVPAPPPARLAHASRLPRPAAPARAHRPLWTGERKWITKQPVPASARPTQVAKTHPVPALSTQPPATSPRVAVEQHSPDNLALARVAQAEQQLTAARLRLSQAQSEQASLAEQRESRTRTLQATVESAQKRLTELQADVRQRESQRQAAATQVAQAEAKAEQLKGKYQEWRDLLAKGYISAQEAGRAQAEFETAAGALETLRERLRQADPKPLIAEISAQETALQRAEAQLRVAQSEPAGGSPGEAVTAAEAQVHQAEAALAAARAG